MPHNHSILEWPAESPDLTPLDFLCGCPNWQIRTNATDEVKGRRGIQMSLINAATLTNVVQEF